MTNASLPNKSLRPYFYPMKKQRRDTELINAVGQRFKELRNAKGLSQEHVYFDTNIHIGRVETGQYNISISTLSELCNYYDISILEFFGGMKIK